MKKIFFGRHVYLAGLLLFIPSCGLLAGDYLGAAAVLEKISAHAPAGTNAEAPSEIALLQLALEAFTKSGPTLTPEAAAGQWLGLLDRQTGLPPETLRRGMSRGAGQDNFHPQRLWEALPPPAAWPALRQAIEARPAAKGAKAARELGLRLLVHTLVADRPAQTNDLAQMEALFAKMDTEEGYLLASTLDAISERVLQNSDDPGVVMKFLERNLARVDQENYHQQFSIPNLVPMIGREKAEAFLRRVLQKSGVEIEVAQGEETKSLARRLALELGGQLKSAQWTLACSLDATALYEALDKRFGQPDSETNAAAGPVDPLLMIHHQARSDQGSRKQAQIYYLLGLVAQNRSKDAAALAQKFGHDESVSVPKEALKQMERAGYTRAVHDFLRELLSQNPELPFWSEYIEIAAKTGETAQMLTLARQAAAREGLSDKRKNLIRQNIYRALLAADEVDEAVTEMRALLSGKEAETGRSRSYEEVSRGDLAINLAKLGQLLGRKELTEEGIRLARKKISETPGTADSPNFYSSTRLVTELADFLMENGRGPEAEAVLTDALAACKPDPASNDYSLGETLQRDYLVALARVYHQAGRHADVVLLLEQSPNWAAKDLAEIRSQSYDSVHQHEDSAEDSLNYCAADSLLALGRKAEAGKIAEALLDNNGGFDPAYELLLKIGGAEVSAKLDALFARDQFEERPLIWKAIGLKQAGKLEEAEAVVRRAIAIDPSDGEQGPGRRMRAYAVLADIRQARGDQKEAAVYRGAVDAIRLSEKADRFYEAGLLKRAVGMYEDSLTHFADAYCIQSRLALRLSELGQHEEAEKHYRRAFELMPESFGRVESHCFGCERAFDGEKAQSIAEKVFTSLAKTAPQKPQVHYLLGYLREEQGRYAEALVHYREAVRLDPEYLNAWKQIESVGREYPLPAADKDAVVLNVIRLDPLGRHSSENNFQNVTDLPALWRALEAAAGFQLHPPATLFPLTASRAQLEKAEAASKNEPEAMARREYQKYFQTQGRARPAQAVLQNGIITATLPLLGGQSGGYE